MAVIIAACLASSLGLEPGRGSLQMELVNITHKLAKEISKKFRRR
jgi:hypothetical protein